MYINGAWDTLGWHAKLGTIEDKFYYNGQWYYKVSGKGINPVYQKCIDTTSANDREKWDEMIEYAKSLGVPEEQCDFLPEKFMEDNYS